MGQEILNPPTVEGWHTGAEWVDTGTLMERVNSAALLLGDPAQSGVRNIIRRLRESNRTYAPDELVDSCLSLCGALEVSGATRRELAAYAASQGELTFESQFNDGCAEQRVADLLQLIVSTREYQMA
jgi:hypothetical protein